MNTTIKKPFTTSMNTDYNKQSQSCSPLLSDKSMKTKEKTKKYLLNETHQHYAVQKCNFSSYKNEGGSFCSNQASFSKDQRRRRTKFSQGKYKIFKSSKNIQKIVFFFRNICSKYIL